MLRAVLLSLKSSAFVIKKLCTRCLEAMLSKAERHAFGILENALLFSIVYKYSKTSFAPSKKRSQVTGVTMLPFGHKGEMKAKNAECKQEDNLLYYLL